MDSNSISTELLKCLKSFNSLLARDDLFTPSSGIPKHIWNDELGRLRVWAANIGAHQKDQSSLDYRLRNASHVQSQIINLLQSLAMTLQDLEEVLIELNEKDPEIDEDDQGKAEVAEIFNDLVQVITHLYRMSILVRQPSQQDRFLRYRKDDAAGYEQFDRSHVQEKFRDADPKVIDRLGTAISNRRRHLKALERHRAKLGKGISHAHLEDHDGASTVISGTLATDYQEGAAVARLESESASGESTTSYAASFLAGEKDIKIPPPPVGYGSDLPFECPYCFFITTTDSRKSWARHVFRDLMPYICIFPDCPTPNRMFDRQRDWSLHLQTHRHDSPSSFSVTLTSCQLCRRSDIPFKKYESHLAEHLEQLALFALPRGMQGDDDNEDDDDNDDNQKKTSNTAASDDSIRLFIPFVEHDNNLRMRAQQAAENQLAEKEAEEEEAEKESSSLGRLESNPKIVLSTPDGRFCYFPWENCRTLADMETSIIHLLGDSDIISTHVKSGRHEFIGPDNHVIWSKNWEATVKPDMTIRIDLVEVSKTRSQERPQRIFPSREAPKHHGKLNTAERVSIGRHGDEWLLGSNSFHAVPSQDPTPKGKKHR